MTRSRILAAEGGILLMLGAANAVAGRLLGTGILFLLGALALAAAWAPSPARR